MSSSIAAEVITDASLNKMASLIKLVAVILISFALLLSGLTYNLGLILGDLETKIGVLGAQTDSFQKSTNIRLERLERQFDTL